MHWEFYARSCWRGRKTEVLLYSIHNSGGKASRSLQTRTSRRRRRPISLSSLSFSRPLARHVTSARAGAHATRRPLWPGERGACPRAGRTRRRWEREGRGVGEGARARTRCHTPRPRNARGEWPRQSLSPARARTHASVSYVHIHTHAPYYIYSSATSRGTPWRPRTPYWSRTYWRRSAWWTWPTTEEWCSSRCQRRRRRTNRPWWSATASAAWPSRPCPLLPSCSKRRTSWSPGSWPTLIECDKRNRRRRHRLPWRSYPPQPQFVVLVILRKWSERVRILAIILAVTRSTANPLTSRPTFARIRVSSVLMERGGKSVRFAVSKYLNWLLSPSSNCCSMSAHQTRVCSRTCANANARTCMRRRHRRTYRLQTT